MWRAGCLGAVWLCSVCLPAPLLAGDDPQLFVRGSYERIVSARQGRNFIVHFWSMECPPCLKEMPLWSGVVKSHPQLELVFVSTDAEFDHTQIRATLSRHELTTVSSWVFADSFAEPLRFEVDRRWYGELPRTYLHAANGEVLTISGALEPGRVEAWLQQQSM